MLRSLPTPPQRESESRTFAPQVEARRLVTVSEFRRQAAATFAVIAVSLLIIIAAVAADLGSWFVA